MPRRGCAGDLPSILDLAFGKYTQARSEFPGTGSTENSITNTATHEWLTLGVRFVLFP